MDRITSMGVFVKTVDLGSLTAAATALGMSPQMVGKHVGFLEARLGAPLLRRTTRRQSLTEIGQAFYQRCRIILADMDLAEALVHDMSATPRGRLRVSAPVGFGACRLAPVVTRYLAAFPDVAVEVNLTDRYVDVVDEGYDAVIRLGPIKDTALAARELQSHRQVACASPAYLAARGTPTVPDDLVGHDCLGYVNWSGLPYAEWRFSKAGHVHAVEVRSRFQVNDGRVLVAAALEGHGIILQPDAILRDALDAGRLVPILADYTAPSRPMVILFAARRPQPQTLRSFIDWVVEAFGPRRIRGRDQTSSDA